VRVFLEPTNPTDGVLGLLGKNESAAAKPKQVSTTR